ncbi:MAG: hypothetical protein ACD_16C00192G0010 [uncultured bacterium]|nr:MAG: hypothetical protein ACD_16C00192G0010 [uncultured bacterium]OFW68164.1 MAG: hypothetical protein A2X70_05665 [Alphaproteobacteria bacterium GWC2_42_16]OFW73557.1 MAG: hypothetical protein A2Z80_06965 [Alphaproteobacteria bacterium GWA2_41_27]OFW82406.1 MAG: hypothetical protein A3E50_04365 [Alphaproteobacteria bacterium RIFCSPHIGHO2_12_FULL_42_100]OFW86231.1 MAG: hypothetical protein A2W06_01295 [Alphaproteobacteria bacterium RBG_16_42_14]OFW91790.1 MAG: hypothetical protein A3C41_013
MFSASDLLTFLLAFLIIAFILSFLIKLQQGDLFKARLKELISYKETLLHEEEEVKRVYEGFQTTKFPRLQAFIEKIQKSGRKEKESIRKLFFMAGFPAENAAFYYGMAKIGTSTLFSGITAIVLFSFIELSVILKIIIILAAGLSGSYFVDIVLYKLVQIRQEKIRKAFPAALDLMVLCTESGLSLSATIQRVAQEISQISPELGYELALLSIELNMFSDRQRALQNFSDRMDSPYFKAIISNIQQAEQYGTPIAQTMRTVSEQFRQDRLLEAETRANKLPTLLTIPMMLFIFPCIYIFVAGPAVIRVLDLLK